MNNLIGVDILESNEDVDCNKPYFLLSETVFVADVVSQVTASKVIHDEVEVLMVLEGAFHIDKEGVVELAEYPTLVEHGLNVILLDDSK